ncbi:hypothetical protein [Pedobacter frigidisoli]|nr:hypothetical protein [Pedobacter frigidisoli]
MEENEITKIAYNCRKATFLIEKKQISTITLREKLELKIHLAGCSVCMLYEKQSRLINNMVKDLFSSPDSREIRLDESFKKELQAQIEKKLNNN